MFTLDSFRTARWLRTLNLLLQAVLFLTFFGGLNYLARNHPGRFDLTPQRRHSLSPETLSYLRNLSQPVRIVVTLTEDSDNPAIAQAYRDMHGLLREYAFATEGDSARKITVQYLDVYQRRRDADQLGIDQPDSIVLICGDRRRTVALGEIYRVVKGEKKAFQGEQAITAAILDVSSAEKKKIYFLTGHGELSPEDVDPVHGLSTLRDSLRQRNFDVEALNLGYLRKIPTDASLLIAVAPQGKFTPFEQELLRQYLSTAAGRLVLLLAPGQPHGLEDLLLDWGLIVDDDLICDTGAQNMTEEGDLLLRFLTPHPVTQTLIDYNLQPRIGPARSVRPDPGRSLGSSLTVTTLAATSTTAWGEVSYRLHTVPQRDPGVDIVPLPGMEPRDRLGVAVASERVSVRDNLPFSVRGGRLIVFGTGDLIANNRIADVANQNIFLSAVNWTVDRDAQFNIPARPIERFQLSLSAGELTKLRYSLLLALPGAAALLGLIVYWTRRR
ncbi:MAG: GldG family protein [Verrucomicrobia bacterium]|nr:GldG family protein [Verrucomicrobiota bacterium]